MAKGRPVYIPAALLPTVLRMVNSYQECKETAIASAELAAAKSVQGVDVNAIAS